MLGFLAGVGISFLVELLNDLVRTPAEVAKHLHIPLLGVIPHASEDRQVKDTDLFHVVQQAPYSVISESYRQFRTNLKLSGPSASSRVLLVSSCSAGDGKTSVAVNLSVAFVAEHKRVLLIDANFWKPNIHQIFDTQKEDGVGLGDVIVSDARIEDAVHPSGIEGIDVLSCGTLPPNPAEMLGSAKMREILAVQKTNYDYIIIDGPPVLLVSDTKMLAESTDGTLLVFNASNTRRGAASRAIRELKQVDASVVGCVLFAVRAMKGGYFSEQFRSYQEYQKQHITSQAQTN